jgi:two-component system, NtrC family, nitrogen regulation response regulator GlnG
MKSSHIDRFSDNLIDASAFAGCDPETLFRAAQPNLPIMIIGAAGPAKEFIARAIHASSSRSSGPFVCVSAAYLETESSGLGSLEKSDSAGSMVSRAKGGTLFIDEVTDLSPLAQLRLFGLLPREERGDEQSHHARIISCAAADISPQVEAGRFHKGLFFYLNVIPLTLAQISNQRTDVVRIIKALFDRALTDGSPPVAKIRQEALDCLARYPWPGDFAELQNFVRRLAALYPGEEVTRDVVEMELARSVRSSESTAEDRSPATFRRTIKDYVMSSFRACAPDLPPPGLYQRALHEFELPLIAAALSATGGNQSKAAKVLGINRNTLRLKVRDLEKHAHD